MAVQSKRHPSTTITIKHNKLIREAVVKFSNFTDGDAHCLIDAPENIAGAKIIVKHYLYPSQNEQVFRLLLLLNSLVDLGAEHIEVFTPYLPYARQDKAHLAGEAISNAILCRLLKKSGCAVLHTIDCHFMKGKPFAKLEGLEINNILVKDSLRERLELLTGKDYSIIGPDEGSSYLSNGNTMKKARSEAYVELKSGIIRRDVATLINDSSIISKQVVVVADDMISTGSTMIKALESLHTRGVDKLYTMTTHGLFLDESYEKIHAYAKGVIFSDTITREGAVPVVGTVFDKLVELL